MIVIDTSALVAILKAESEGEPFLDIIGKADRRLMSAVTLLEAQIVMRGRYGRTGVDDLAELIAEIAPEIVPFDEGHALLAFEAFTRYGKGIDPQARLNICDCVSYALARAMNVPLLYKGEDFSETDVAPFV